MLFVITQIGLDAVAIAGTGGPKVDINTYKYGESFNYTPNASDTDLRGNILHIGVPSNYRVEDDDTVAYTLLTGETIGTFDFGEVGLYLASGELFALVAFDKLQEKRATFSGVPGNVIEIVAKLQLSGVIPLINFSSIPTVGASFVEFASYDLLSTPVSSTSNVFLITQPNVYGDVGIAVKETDTKWRFPDTFDTVIESSVTDDPSNTPLRISLTGTLSNFPVKVEPDRFIIQFISGPHSGSVRRVINYQPNFVEWDVPIGAIPLAGEDFEILEARFPIIRGSTRRTNNSLCELNLRNSINMTRGNGILSFTRASVGYRLNRFHNLEAIAANLPRFEHGELLIEGASTNNLNFATDFSTGSWTRTGVDVTAPAASNLFTIDNVPDPWVIANIPPALGSLSQVATVSIPTDSNPVAASIFIGKDNDETRFPKLELVLSGGTPVRGAVQLNTKTGVITNFSDNITDPILITEDDDWWRVTVSATNDGTNNVATFNLYPADSGIFGVEAQTGVIGSITADMAQLEIGNSFSSSPIPTTNTPVTREADILNLDIENIADPSEQLTYLCTMTPRGTHTSTAYIFYCVGEVSRYLSIEPELSAAHGTTILTGLELINNVQNRIGLRNDGTDLSIWHNGLQISSIPIEDVSGTITSIAIGSDGTGANSIFGRLSNISIYDFGLSDSEMLMA